MVMPRHLLFIFNDESNPSLNQHSCVNEMWFSCNLSGAKSAGNNKKYTNTHKKKTRSKKIKLQANINTTKVATTIKSFRVYQTSSLCDGSHNGMAILKIYKYVCSLSVSQASRLLSTRILVEMQKCQTAEQSLQTQKHEA